MRRTTANTPPASVAFPVEVRARGGTDAPEPTTWGEDLASLHDLFWASRCIRVVRPGEGDKIASGGPALYLLLDRHQIVHFPTRAVVKQMHWTSPRLLRLRILVHAPADYTEHVAQSAGGVRFRRSYVQSVERAERAWVTADPAVARVWADAEDSARGRRALRVLVPRDSIESLVVKGDSGRATDPATVERWSVEALHRWTRPNAVIPTLYEFQPGVWVHESAVVAPRARIHGAVWIGAGRVISNESVVIGPVVLPDAPGYASALASPEVDWTLVRSPYWSLPSLTAGGTFRRAFKRAFDIGFSLLVLLATLPLYIPIMVAIFAEDRGPFFFAHRRQTIGGKEFPCLKFRTMRRDAEKIKADLMSTNAADGPQFYLENDPRVTQVGQILRRYQLDELPQFINVLLGHMSVVGPRPSPEKENQFCPAWREARLSVRPGITGLWQVSRTREPQTDFQEWIRYDLEYVQHQSIVGDMRIIFETVRDIIKK